MRWIDETFHPAQRSTRRDGSGVLQGRQEDEEDATEGTKLQGGLHLSVNERCLGPHRAEMRLGASGRATGVVVGRNGPNEECVAERDKPRAKDRRAK